MGGEHQEATGPARYPESGYTRVHHDVILQVGQQLTAADLHVYCLLGMHADVADGTCFPSMRRLASIARMNERSIRRSISRLAAAGMVEVERQTGTGNRYRLPRLDTRAGADSEAGGSAEGRTVEPGHPGLFGPPTPGSSVRPPRTEEPYEQEPINKTQEQDPNNKTRRKAAADVSIPPELDTAEFREAWGRWLVYRRERRLTMAAMTLTGQLRKLATSANGNAVEWIEAAITGGWQGLYEPRKGVTNGGRGGRAPIGPGQKYAGGQSIQEVRF